MKCLKNQMILSLLAAVSVLMFVIFSAFHIKSLNTSYSVRQFFPMKHSLLDLDDHFKRVFELNSAPTYFAILERLPQDQGDWLDKENANELKRITSELENTENVKSVLSIANVDLASNTHNELRIGPVFEVMEQSEWNEKIAENAVLEPQLISKDRKAVLIAIEPKNIQMHEMEQLEARIEKVVTSTQSYSAGLAGVPVMQSTLARKLQSELGLFLVLCFVVFVVAFALFFRNFSLLFFVGIGLMLCNFCVLGALAYLQIPFTVLLGTLPIIVSIAFVSLAIHTLHLWSDNLRIQAPSTLLERWRLSITTLSDIFRGNLLGSATTAIGFAALAATEIPAIQQFAWSVAGGVMLTFVLSQFVFLVSLSWLNPIQRKWMAQPAHWILYFTKHARAAMILVVLIAAGLAIKIPHLNYSARLFDEIPTSEPVHSAMKKIDSHFGGTVPLEILVKLSGEESWKSASRIKELEQAVAEIRLIPNVGSVLGLSDFVRSEQAKSSELLSETFFLFSLSQKNPLRHFLDQSAKTTRIAVRVPDLTSDEVLQVRSEIQSVLERRIPQGVLAQAGMGVLSYTINSEVAHELVFGFWQSVAIIGLLLLLVFRSWRYALVACLPNLLAPLMLIGAMALIGTPVKPAIALIFSIGIGLAFNNTVYILSRLKKLQHSSKSKGSIIDEALLVEGNPCLSESLLTFAGFVIFLASSFSLNRVFGGYMILSIAAAAIGDLVFMPAFMKLFARFLKIEVEHNSSSEVEKLSVSSKRAAAVIGALLVFGIGSSSAANEAQDLLEKSRQHIEAKSDQAKVVLKTTEANGDVQTRELLIKSLREDKVYYALARVEAPADVKGTALLAEIKSGTENQWLYLPASKQVRRVVSAKKSSGVLGSELSPDDLNTAALQSAKAELIRKDDKTAVIQVTPSSGASDYSKVLVTLSVPAALPQQVAYFKGAKESKVVEFKDYISTKSKIYRARRIVVINKENGRRTEVLLSDVKINLNFTSSDFTVAALKRN